MAGGDKVPIVTSDNGWFVPQYENPPVSYLGRLKSLSIRLLLLALQPIVLETARLRIFTMPGPGPFTPLAQNFCSRPKSNSMHQQTVALSL